MLDIAKKHEGKLKDLFTNIIFDEKFMFYNNSSYYREHIVDGSTWNNHTFVSLNENKDVIGYINYSIDRSSNNVDSIGIINFTNDKRFGKDVYLAIDDMFCKFKFNKLELIVVVGNPIEKTYDKLSKKYGGRIVGTRKKSCKLMDGNLYDIKMYEIFREDYIRNRPNYFKKGSKHEM